MDLWFDHLDDKVGRPSSRYSRVMKALYQTQFEVVLERDDAEWLVAELELAP